MSKYDGWFGTLIINNNTDYKIDWFYTSGLGAIKHTKRHTIATINAGQQGVTNTVNEDSHGMKSNDISYHLWFYTDKPKHSYMKGSVSLGPSGGFANRGDLTTQNIKMYGECNDIYDWWQTGNLTDDQCILPWTMFNPLSVISYKMTLTFEPQS